MAHRPDDARTLAAATEVLEGRPPRSKFRRLLPFLGSAFIACVAYVDPGNFAIGLDPTRTLVISQVVLSFGIPFALIPLVMFTRDDGLMGVLVNRRLTTIIAAIVAALIVALNVFLLYQTFTD